MISQSQIKIRKFAIKYSPPTLTVEYIQNGTILLKSIKIKLAKRKVNTLFVLIFFCKRINIMIILETKMMLISM